MNKCEVLTADGYMPMLSYRGIWLPPRLEFDGRSMSSLFPVERDSCGSIVYALPGGGTITEAEA